MRKRERCAVTDAEVEESKRKPSPSRAHLLVQNRDGQDQRGAQAPLTKGTRVCREWEGWPAERPRAGGAPGTVPASPGRLGVPGAGAGTPAGSLPARRSERLSEHSVLKRAFNWDSLDTPAKPLMQNTETKTA